MGNKRQDQIHELNKVCNSFRQFVSLLEQGYEFSENENQEVLQELKDSISVLSNEIQSLKSEWSPELK